MQVSPSLWPVNREVSLCKTGAELTTRVDRIVSLRVLVLRVDGHRHTPQSGQPDPCTVYPRPSVSAPLPFAFLLPFRFLFRYLTSSRRVGHSSLAKWRRFALDHTVTDIEGISLTAGSVNRTRGRS